MCRHDFGDLEVVPLLMLREPDVYFLETSIICQACGAALSTIDSGVKQAQLWFTPLGEGPGTILKRRLEKAGYRSCDKCYLLALKMNKLGADLCEARLPQLVDEILPRAQEAFAQKHEWVNKFLEVAKVDKATLSAGVSSIVMRSIQEWRQLESATLK